MKTGTSDFGGGHGPLPSPCIRACFEVTDEDKRYTNHIPLMPLIVLLRPFIITTVIPIASLSCLGLLLRFIE